MTTTDTVANPAEFVDVIVNVYCLPSLSDQRLKNRNYSADSTTNALKTYREGTKAAKEKEQSYEKDKEGIIRMVNGL